MQIVIRDSHFQKPGAVFWHHESQVTNHESRIMHSDAQRTSPTAMNSGTVTQNKIVLQPISSAVAQEFGTDRRRCGDGIQSRRIKQIHGKTVEERASEIVSGKNRGQSAPAATRA